MKNVILNTLRGILYSFFFTVSSFAQSRNADLSLAASKITSPVFSGAEPDATVNSAPTTATNTAEEESQTFAIRLLKSDVKAARANIRILNHMQKNYKNSKNAEWKFEGQHIVATIKEDDVTTRVVFMENGRWLRLIRTYKPSGLQADVKRLITRKFPRSAIKEIQEVQESNEVLTAYYIRVEDEIWSKDMLVYGGKVDVYNVEKKK